MSGRRLLRPRVFAVLLGVLLASAAIGVAVAVTTTNSVPVAENASATAKATCATGKRATLGGFTTTLTEGGPYVHPRSLVLSGRSTRAAGVNEQGPGLGGGTGRVTAIAYCGTRRFLGKASAFNTIPPGARRSATALCPKNMYVAAGGFRADIAASGNGALVYVDGLERVSARKWRASAINDGSAPGKVEALAYCFPGSQSLKTVTKSVLVSPGNTGNATAKCPKGKTVLFGGVRSEHYGTEGGELQLSSMRRAGKRGWTVSALKFANVVGRLTSVAYCS